MPVGLFIAFVVYRQLKVRPVIIKKASVDCVGLIALVIGVGALQITLDRGSNLDWFESDFIAGNTLIAVIVLAFFIIWEFTDRHPIVNLCLFARRNFTTSTLALVLGYAALSGTNLLLSQWLQTQMNYAATWAGLAAAPIGILPMFLSPLVDRYTNYFDLRMLTDLSFLAIAITHFMHTNFATEVDYQHITIMQLIMRLDMALFFMPILNILLSGLSPDQIADDSGPATFLRTLGGSFAAPLTTWTWNRRATQHHIYLGENISLYNPATHEIPVRLGGNTQVNATLLSRMVQSQAYMMSTIDYFTILGWLFLTLSVIIRLVRPPFGTRPGTATSGH